MTTPERGWTSAAHLNGTALVVPCRAAELAARIARFGLELSRPAFARSDEHPLCIEFWHVVEGGFEALGLSQREWFERAGAAYAAASSGLMGVTLGASLGALGGAAALGALGLALGPIGSWLGATSGWVGGGTVGSLTLGLSAATSGSRLGEAFGREVSRTTSRALGTYYELLLSVPYTKIAGGSGEPLCFVLGMLSDSPIALWGDRMLGCGYRKRRAIIHRSSTGGFEVYDGAPEATRLLACHVDATQPSALPDAARAAICAWWAQPLAGEPAPGELALTAFERRLCEPQTRIWSAPALLELAARSELAPLIGRKCFISGVSERAPWGAFHMQHVPVRLSEPWRPSAAR